MIYLSDRPPSQIWEKVILLGALDDAWPSQNMLDPISILLLGRLRCQEINLHLQTRISWWVDSPLGPGSQYLSGLNTR